MSCDSMEQRRRKDQFSEVLLRKYLTHENLELLKTLSTPFPSFLFTITLSHITSINIHCFRHLIVQ